VLREDDSRSTASWLSYDSTTYGWSVWLLNGAVLENAGDGSLEVVLRGTGALLSDLEVAIVDPAVINGAKGLRASLPGNKDCRFRRHCNAGESNELVMRIEQDILFSTIGGFMLTHSFGSFSNVGIDEPKCNVLRGEFVFDAPYLRNVAIGDGAIGCDKKENYGLGTRSGKTGNRLAIHVVTVGWRHSLRMRDNCQ
jgi:hypothetical protein